MSQLQLVEICLVALVLITVFSWIKGWRNKRFKYEFKRSINNLSTSLVWILSVYILVGVALLVSGISVWIVDAANKQTSELGEYIILSYPYAIFVVAIVIIVCLFIRTYKGCLKYTDQEKQWLKEDREKFKAKLPKSIQKALDNKVVSWLNNH